MATSLVSVIDLFKEIGLYDTVFPGILIFAFVYGVLYRFQPFGKNNVVNGIVALVVALIFISFVKAVTFLSYLVPLLTAMLVVLLLLLMVFMFMGVSEKRISESMQDSAAYGTIIVLIVIFVLIALSSSFPEFAGGDIQDTGELSDLTIKSAKVIFNPVVLGLVVLTLVFAIATYYITRQSKST